MEIQVQCIDGEVSCFTVADERISTDFIRSIKPSEMFHQPQLRIQAGKRTSVFNMKAVESIYVSTSLKLTISEQLPIAGLTTISETEYLEKLESLTRQCESDEKIFEPGRSIDTLVALHGVSGSTHYLQARVTVKVRVEQLMDLHNLLGRLPSVIPCTPEGYIAINPSNIKRIEIYPAPAETMHSAWLVD